MIALRALARNSGPFALILLRVPQNHIQWGVFRPPREHRSEPLSTSPACYDQVTVKPASSKNMNGFHQLSALSPSKKIFTVRKTNTDNNDIFFLSQKQASSNKYCSLFSIKLCFKSNATVTQHFEQSYQLIVHCNETNRHSLQFRCNV